MKNYCINIIEMGKKILFLVFIFFMFVQMEAQVEMRITWDYREMSFGEFVLKAEEKLNLRFFYREEWIRDLIPGNFSGKTDLSEFLDAVFQDKSLFYYIDEYGNVLITKNFAVKVSDTPKSSEQNFIAPTEYYDTQDKQKLSGNLYVDIGNPADRFKTGNATISGYITNRDTKEPVAGATVFLQKLSIGTVSNAYGFYSMSLPRGVHLLQFSFIGMKEKQVNVNLYGSGELDLDMNSMLIPLKETVISAEKQMIFQRYEVGVEKVNISSFKLLPTSLGESDIIKSVLLIPGVQSVGEGSAGFNVRGGSSDQNLILLYGAPVYNTSHMFGFFSAVNSDIIKDVTLYKGGIPGRYGGRISSVLDITSRDGNRKEFAGNAGISPITTHLMLEGPIIKDKLTYLLTGRMTYSNWVFKLVDDPSIQNSTASFYDANGRIVYDINKKNRLEVASYLSHDSFRLNSDTLYGYNNSVVTMRWKHFFNSRFFSLISLNNSNYRYNVSSESNPAEGFVLSHQVNSTGLKADFNWYQGRNEVNYGVDLTLYSVLPGSLNPTNDSSLIVPQIIERERALEGALYIDDKYVVNDFFSINAGFRFSSFFALGPKTFLKYDPDYPSETDDAKSVYSFLECFHTIRNQDSFLSLMDASFVHVYRYEPDKNFKDEWIFLTRRLAEGNPGIMSKEPCWVLFDSASTTEPNRANVRKAVVLEAAKSFKKNYPNLTQKQAAAKINEWLVENKYEEYSVKHLVKIINHLKFKLGKSGRPPEK